MTVKGLLRRFVYGAADRVGVNGLVAGLPWRRNRLLILCYHGFSMADEHLWRPSLYIQPDTFRRRVALLRAAGYRVLPLGRALDLLETGDLPPRSVAITVDDGSKNFIEAGYPVIRGLQVPVTAYVSTYYVFDRRPVFDVCASYLLWRGSQAGARLVRQRWLLGPTDLGGGRQWAALYRQLYCYSRDEALGADAKHEVLRDLAGEVGVDFDDLTHRELFHLMSPADLARLDPELVDLQLHTHRHTMPPEATLVEREIRDNRAGLSSCGRRPEQLVHFCYPSGVYHRPQLAALRDLGIKSATTCVPGIASRSCDPLLLPRFIDSESVTEAAFLTWLSGLGALLRPRRIP